MPIDDRNLKAGTKLVGRYHKQAHTCEVVEGEGGKLKFRLADGREFKSPSGAGMAITGHACDGWAFWSVQKGEAGPAADAPKTEAAKEASVEPVEANDAIAEGQKGTPVEAATAAVEPGQAKKSPIFRNPNQRGVPEGKVRWYCHDCRQSFLASVGETPQACPQGHGAG